MSMQYEMGHRYGSQVHILDNPIMNGLLAKLCSPNCHQPEINHLVESLYSYLVTSVISHEFKAEKFVMPTRMTEHHPDKKLHGTRVALEQRAVAVNLARAGTYPSHICYDFLHNCLPAENIRQDHIFAARTTNKSDKVTGAEFSGMKIGGGIKGAYVLFPDPMGATGNTMVHAIEHYKQHVPGPALKFIAINLIITPEYLKNILSAHPDVVIYTLRLDRGLSPQAVLDAIPGEFWDQERGLNDKQYIVPGGGGFGEIMNNSFV